MKNLYGLLKCWPTKGQSEKNILINSEERKERLKKHFSEVLNRMEPVNLVTESRHGSE